MQDLVIAKRKKNTPTKKQKEEWRMFNPVTFGDVQFTDEEIAATYGRDKGESIGHRWFAVVKMHLGGCNIDRIKDLTGFTQIQIRNILDDPRSIKVRNRLLEEFDRDFEALQRKVYAVIEEKMESKNERVQLQATEQWLKIHGKYQETSKGIAVTAEDVVIQILNNNYGNQK